jgi:hypothetical protein
MADATTPAVVGTNRRCGSLDLKSGNRNNTQPRKSIQELAVARISKNSRETIHVAMTNYLGHRFVSLRVFFLDDRGELRPGKQGLTVAYRDIPQVIEAMQRAYDSASSQGVVGSAP